MGTPIVRSLPEVYTVHHPQGRWTFDHGNVRLSCNGAGTIVLDRRVFGIGPWYTVRAEQVDKPGDGNHISILLDFLPRNSPYMDDIQGKAR